MEKTYKEINEKIESGKAKVLTAFEAKELIKEKGEEYLLKNIDVVTTASYEMHTNAFVYLSFGQTDPLIYFTEAYINNVLCYPLGPTDLSLSCVVPSKSDFKYSGANVLEDLVNKKDVHLKALGNGRALDVFPNQDFETWFNLDSLNQCRLLLNQAVNQNNIVATNSGNKDLSGHMGTLIAHFENSTFNSTSSLNPLINDPYCKTIGVGTKVWIAGSIGFITGYGSNHNPMQKRNKDGLPVGQAITLSAIADVKLMDPKWVRAGYIKSYGPVLYIGVGIPIPILNLEVAKSIAVTDDKIHTTIVDFAIPRRTKPTFGQCTYSELRRSTISINSKPTLAAPLSSMALSIEVSEKLKKDITNKNFLLTEPIDQINLNVELKKLDARLGN